VTTRAYVGTSGWSYPAWRGGFYPAGHDEADMLRYYADRLGAVEVNNTFYRMPKSDVLQRWAATVPPGFRFALKASRRISHHRRLADAGDDVRYLVTRARLLGDALGPILIQPPPFLRKDLPRLEAFLAELDPQLRWALEFRHGSWFDEDVYARLAERGVALAFVDRDGDDDLEVPLHPTAEWGYVRLRRAAYTDAELDAWADRLRRAWSGELWAFFMHEDAGEAPGLAQRLAARLGSGPAVG
jgi:uncharacterized protein YecE (DUF72 family)